MLSLNLILIKKHIKYLDTMYKLTHLDHRTAVLKLQPPVVQEHTTGFGQKYQ